MSDGRIGVFGGTFDPPHVGHRIVALDIVSRLSLDRLVIVPAARPPHREPVLPAADRLALTRAAFAGDSRIEVSDVEYRRDGPSFTVDTLERIGAVHPDGRLFLVVGADQYEEFGHWHRPDRILELARLAVMERNGRSPAPDAPFPFEPLDVTRVDVSSTEVRRRLSEGRSIRYLVPDAIRDGVERAWNDATQAKRTTGYETTC